MTIVSYNELLGFAGFDIDARPIMTGVRSRDDVNASSIDVRLGDTIITENIQRHTLRLGSRDAMSSSSLRIAPSQKFVLNPGGFVLAHTAETFNLPLDISAEFRLKSSAARMGLSHALAVWCDPGWHGSTLTLELHNISRHHFIEMEPGDKIGQMIFHRHEPVPIDASYARRGAYNNDAVASGAKPPRSKP